MRPGDVVAERFIVLRRAGDGGTSDVYEATDGPAGPRVALKVMRAEAIDVVRFEREATVLAAVPHPSIVRYLAHGALPDGRAYLAIEWVDGETLAARMQRGPLGGDESVRIARSAARTLGHLHAVGVVHRDVKPSNLMIRAGTEDDVVVMDFGLARAPATQLSMRASAFLGTPAYVAPEQIDGAGDVDPRADVYSLGCVLFECLTGRPVFTGAGAVAVLAKVAVEPAPSLARLRPDLPASLAAIVDRTLRKARHERYADGAALGAELASVPAIESHATSIPPPRPEPRLRRSEPPRGPFAGRAAAACVGRESELALLSASYAACVEDSSARAVLMTAPPGFGKTRLCEELLVRLTDAEVPPNVIVAAARAQRTRSAFAFVATIVRRAIGVAEGAPEREVTAALERFASTVGSPEPEKTVALLRSLLVVRDSYATPDPTTSREEAWTAHERTRLAVRTCLEAVLASGPLVLALDDLHWADGASVRLVDSMLEQLRDRPLLVVALSRPDIHDRFPSLWADRNVLRMQLDGLKPRDAESLARDVLGDAAQPETIKRIVMRAEGNALFLEELSRARAEGRGDAMPSSVLAILKTRLDALDPHARRVLGAASVLGGTFALEAVTAICGDPKPGSLRASLDRLVALDLLQPSGDDPGGRDRLSFRHALIAEAAYALVRDDERRAAHRAAGEWLEAHDTHDAGVVAEHFERAGLAGRAAPWFARAGQEAMRAQEPQAALDAFARASASQPPRPLLGAIRAWEGHAQVWIGQWDAAEKSLEEAVDLLEPGDPIRATTVAGLVLSATLTGRVAPVVRGVAELRTMNARRDAGMGVVLTGFLVALSLCAAGQRALAHDLCAPVFTSPPSEDARERGWLALCRGVLAETGDGALGPPLASYRDATACFASAGASFAQGMSLRFEGRTLLGVGAWDAACTRLLESLQLLGRLTGGPHVALTKNLLAWSVVGAGRPAEGTSLARETLEEFERTSNPLGIGQSTTVLALAALASGDLRQADVWAARSDEAQAMLPLGRSHALVLRAEVALRRGAVQDATRLAAEALHLFEGAGGWAYTEGPLRSLLVRSRRAAGDVAGAEAALRTLGQRAVDRGVGLPEELARIWSRTARDGLGGP